MKVSLASSFILAFCLSAFGTQAMSMGQRAQIFEKATDAGIWDHGNEFYLRMDLNELGELKDQKFVWAGFHLDGSGKFVGEVVADNFGKDEKRFPARATQLTNTKTGRYFLIEVLDASDNVIKEIIVKGPASTLPDR